MSEYANGDGHGQQLLGPYEFTEELAERLETAAGMEKVGRRHLGLQVVFQGRTLQIELDQFYNAYQRYPEQLDAIASKLLRAIQEHAQTRGAVSFDEIRDRVYPMLKPIEILADIFERKLPMLAYRPLLADLIITYVIDEERSVVYLNDEHMAAWGVREEELYKQSLENLRRRTLKPDMCTIVGEGDRQLIIYSTEDGYDAARLLLTELLEEWQQQLPGQLVIGIPNRDFLVGFSDANPAILRQIAQQISVDASQREYALTDQLFTLVDGRLQLYEYSSSGGQD